MKDTTAFEAIIIGGSYAGLSAAMALGRARRRVLIIDDHQPCNRQTPHSHNFLTQDGQTPAAITALARRQVEAYATITFIQDTAIESRRKGQSIRVTTANGKIVTAPKLLLATGVQDTPLPVPGFSECWGISALHCPYCHGYEVHDEPLGIIASGDMAYEYARLIYQWSPRLTVFTNGPVGMNEAQLQALQAHGIPVWEEEIAAMVHQAGRLQHLLLKDGTQQPLKAVFGRGPVTLRDELATMLGCSLVEEGMAKGLIQVDEFSKTSQPDIFAAGDNCIAMRSVAAAVAAGNKAGAIINRELVVESF